MTGTTTNFSWTYPTPFASAEKDLWGYTLVNLYQEIDTEVATRSANYDFAGYELGNALLTDYAEKTQTVSSSSGVLTIDYTAGQHVYTTLTENITSIVINNAPASGKTGMVFIEFTQDGTGGRTVALSSFEWGGGSAPTITATANAVDEIALKTRNAGSTWKGVTLGQDFS